MPNTPNLDLPLLAAAQAQKHVTLNEALLRLDDVVQASVLNEGLNAPPAAPAEGARHIVGPAPTLAWSGWAGRIAVFRGGQWESIVPKAGWQVFVEAAGASLVFDGSAWTAPAGSFAALGVNTSTEPGQRLAVRSPNVLFDHEGASTRLKVNRATTTDTASVLFQNAYDGRAEFGLQGDDRFRLKVSPSTGNWIDALVVERATGLASVAANPTASLGVATKAYVDTSADRGPFEYQTGADQSVTGSAAWQKVLNFTTARIASAQFATAASAFTANRAGVHMLIGQAQVTLGTPATSVVLAFGRNGAPTGNWVSRNLAASATEAIQITSLMQLAVGDVVELLIYTTSNCTLGLGYTAFGGARV
jgi:hypothetical protein